MKQKIMLIPSYPQTIDEQIKEMEQLYSIQIGRAIIPAKISRTLKVLGWVLPGGKVVLDKEVALTVANNLNKLIKN